MVDVVVNNVMALDTDPDLSTYMFQDKVSPATFHPWQEFNQGCGATVAIPLILPDPMGEHHK